MEAVSSDKTIDPVIKITNCMFPSYSSLLRTSISELVKDATPPFALDIQNSHEDENDCKDYKGTIHIKNNEFGVVSNEKFKILGGQRLEMDGNVFDVLDQESFLLENIREIVVEDNK